MLVSNNVVIWTFIVFLTYFDASCLGYHLLPYTNTSLIRERRQAACSPPDVRCGDGSCVPYYKVCDANQDCADGSDELDNCNPDACPGFSFKCAYSACVDGDAKCDGKADCRDGSDEVDCGGTNTPTNSACDNAFACKTGGGCVFFYKVCDGVRDCSDGSDETYAECKAVTCPGHAFRCSYGACVDGDFRCNGQQECADGSDEDPTICGGPTTTPKPTPVPPLAGGVCPVINLANGKFDVLGQGYTPGAPIPNYALVKLSCNANFALYPANALINCLDGNWNVPVPECKQTCPPRISSSVDVTCTVDGHTVDCTKPLVEGTVARSTCKHFYTQTHNEIPTSRCTGGSWDNPLIHCVPECGEVVSDGTVNVINGLSAKKGEFPWHIGLYRFIGGKHDYQCGGSIITPLIILTAAHCFTDELGTERYPAQEYYVAAGKYYSDYNSAEDKLAQRNQVKDYSIPAQYRGYESNFAGDLAVVVLVKVFQLTNVVQPVCVEWDNRIEPQQLKPNNRGSVVGWGYVDPNKQKASVELKQLNAPYIDVGACLDVVPKTFRRWVTPDKFCAGFTNGSSVCKGDSGGGMVFEWNENNRQKFYIRGLVSAGPVTKGVCDNFQYGVYTKVSAYYDFILDVINSNSVKD